MKIGGLRFRRGGWPTGQGGQVMTCGIWGCILSELKEYTPRPPKKNFGGIANFPPNPLETPKGRGLRPPPLESHP